MICGRVSANGVDLAYREVGTGLPVVFLHGGWLDASHFEKNLPAVGERYRAIAYDRRGCGLSTRDVSHSPELWAEDLRQVILQLADGSAVVVGSSYGGLTVMEGMVRFPGLILGAVISAARGRGFRGPEPPFVEFQSRLADLEKVRIPVRVIHGAADEGCPPSLGLEVAKTIPGADFISIPGAGHSVHRHRPEGFNEALLEFLDRLPAVTGIKPNPR